MLFITKTRSERGNLTKRCKTGNRSHGQSVCTGHKHLFCMIMKAETMVHLTVCSATYFRCSFVELWSGLTPGLSVVCCLKDGTVQFVFPHWNFNQKQNNYTTAIIKLLLAFVNRRQLISKLSIPSCLIMSAVCLRFTGNYWLRPREQTVLAVVMLL